MLEDIVTPPERAASETPVEFRREELASPVGQRLISLLNAELEARYPEEGANFFRLDPEEVAEGRGAFLVAYLDDKPVGCGAVRMIAPAVEKQQRAVRKASKTCQDY